MVKISHLNLNKGFSNKIPFILERLNNDPNTHSDLYLLNESHVTKYDIQRVEDNSDYLVIQCPFTKPQKKQINNNRNLPPNSDFNYSNSISTLIHKKFENIYTVNNFPEIRTQHIILNLEKQVHIFNIYLLPENNLHTKEKFTKLVINQIKDQVNLIDDLVIIAGDFNDVKFSNTLLKFENKNLRNAIDLTDLKFTPQYTFHRKDTKSHIDFIFISEEAEAFFSDYQIEYHSDYDREVSTSVDLGSDHNFQHIVLDIDTPTYEKLKPAQEVKHWKFDFSYIPKSTWNVINLQFEDLLHKNDDWDLIMEKLNEILLEHCNVIENKPFKKHFQMNDDTKETLVEETYKKTNLKKLLIKIKEARTIISKENLFDQHFFNRLLDLFYLCKLDPDVQHLNRSFYLREQFHNVSNLIEKSKNRISTLNNRANHQNIRYEVNSIIAGIEENKFKAFKLLNSRNNKSVTKVKRRLNGVLTFTSDPQLIMDYYYEEWKQIYEDEPELPLNLDHFIDPKNPLDDKALTEDFTVKEYFDVVRSLSKRKASGTDKIPYEFYQGIDSKCSKLIVQKFNMILNTAVFPPSWKENMTSLIYKSGDSNNCLNYRPISLINTSCKIFNKILNERLMKLLLENKTIYQHQYGFKPRKSTSCNLFLLQEVFMRSRDLHVLYVDFTKAFDNVSHEMLIKTLETWGFGFKFQNLIKNMLANNTTQIITKFGLTKEINIKKGTRQGDPISSTLFNIYINSFFEKLNSETNGVKLNGLQLTSIGFADDMVMFSDNEDDFKKQIKILEDFSEYSFLKVNLGEDKTAYSTSKFTKPIKNLKFLNNDVITIKSNQCYRYLGIQINVNLNWSEQYNLVENELKKLCFFISKKKYLSTNMQVMLVKMAAQAKAAYVMNTVIFPKSRLEKLDKIVVGSLKRFNIENNSSREFWFHERRITSFYTISLARYTQNLLKVMNTNNFWICLNKKFILQDANLTFDYPALTKNHFHNLSNILASYGLNIINTLNDPSEFSSYDGKLIKRIDMMTRGDLNSFSKWYTFSDEKTYEVYKDDLLNIPALNSIVSNRTIREITTNNIKIPNPEYYVDFTKVEEKNGYILIGTDGAKIKDEFFGGVYFNEEFKFRIQFEGNICINITEIKTILFALEIVDGNYNVIIFSDSQNSINALHQTFEFNEDFFKCYFGPYIKQFEKLKLLFDLKKHEIKFEHIYSHIPEKLRLAGQKSSNELLATTLKIEQNLKKLGEYADIAQQLNIGADAIAGDTNVEPVEFYEPFITRNSLPYLLVNEKGDISGDIYKFLKKDINQKKLLKWRGLHQNDIGYQMLYPPQYYTYTHLRKRMNSTKYWHQKDSNVIHKMLLKILPTRDKMFHRVSSWDNQNSWPKNLQKRKERLSKVYNKDHCPFCDFHCNYQTDTQDHIFSSCNSAIIQNRELALKIDTLKLAYNYGHVNVYWFNTTLDNYNPQLLFGDYGFLPVQLRDEFPKFPNQHWDVFKEGLIELVINNLLMKWKNRCQMLYEAVKEEDFLKQLEEDINQINN